MPKKAEKAEKSEKRSAAVKKSRNHADKSAEVRKSLIDELTKRGYDGKVYLDLVDKYMDLWSGYMLLVKDVEERGLYYTTETASGAMVVKDNPSVKLIPTYNKQMIMFLKTMGLLDVASLVLPEDDEL